MNSQDLHQLGINTFDIRDFVDLNFIKEYKETIIHARKWLDKKSKHCNNGDRRSDIKFVKYFEKLIGKDYSHLKKENYYQLDYEFVSDCFNYIGENNIKKLPDGGVPKNSSPLTSLCIMSDELYTSGIESKWTKLYYDMTRIINDKIIDLNFPDVRQGPAHFNVMMKNSYLSVHSDEMGDGSIDYVNGIHIRPLTIINYPNVNRTLKDGSLYRYFIPKKNYSAKKLKLQPWSNDFKFSKLDILEKIDIYEGSWTRAFLKMGYNYYDIIPDYKTVLVMDNVINDGVFGNVAHMVTRNNSENIRYSIYRQTFQGKATPVGQQDPEWTPNLLKYRMREAEREDNGEEPRS